MGKEIDLSKIEKNKNIFDSYIVNLYSKEKLDDIKQITKSLLLSLIPIHDNENCIKYYNLIKTI